MSYYICLYIPTAVSLDGFLSIISRIPVFLFAFVCCQIGKADTSNTALICIRTTAAPPLSPSAPSFS